MKSILITLVPFLLFSCGKESVEQRMVAEESSVIAPYDTIAIDSFSQGATSVDIARKIKMSSLKFQDSLKQVKLKTEEAQLLQKAKEEKLLADKKIEEAQKRAEASQAKEKAIPKPESVSNQ